MYLRKTLFQARAEVQEILKWQVGMQPADNVKLRNRLRVPRGRGFKRFFQRHGVSARRIFLPPKSAEPASGHANIRWVDMAVDVKVCLVPVHPLARGGGHSAYRAARLATVKRPSLG